MRNLFTHWVRAYGFCLFFAPGLHAEPALATEMGRIALSEALARTLERNPDLIAFGYQIEAVRGQLTQAGLAPRPELTVNVEDAFGSDELQGIDSAETTVSLGWVLEGAIRERRVDVSQANLALSTADADILRVDTSAETARRFLQILSNQARAAIASQAATLAQDTVKAVRRRVDAGGTPKADVARALGELARAQLAQEDITHELRVARHRLAAQWGEPAPDFNQVRGDPFLLPETVSFADLRERVMASVDIVLYMSKERAAEAELRLAEVRSSPPWQARLGVRRIESTNDHALVAGITVPLSMGNRNQGRIAETRADLKRSRAETVAAQVRVETTLFAMYEALQHSLHRSSILKTKVIPRLQSALKETRTAYERGRYGYLAWQTVQAELMDAERELLDASIDAHSSVIEIERLTGVRVVRQGMTP